MNFFSKTHQDVSPQDSLYLSSVCQSLKPPASHLLWGRCYSLSGNPHNPLSHASLPSSEHSHTSEPLSHGNSMGISAQWPVLASSAPDLPSPWANPKQVCGEAVGFRTVSWACGSTDPRGCFTAVSVCMLFLSYGTGWTKLINVCLPRQDSKTLFSSLNLKLQDGSTGAEFSWQP